MMLHRVVGLLLVGVVAAVSHACAGRVQPLANTCADTTYGREHYDLRRAKKRSGARSAGGVLVTRLIDGRNEDNGVPRAVVTIYTDTLIPDLGAYARGDISDSLGTARLDSVPAGTYMLLVRRIGYDWVRQKLRVRAGYQDTARIVMRQHVMCIVEPVVPAPGA